MIDKSTILTCPKCKSANICEISYGYPGDIEEYLQLVAEKKIHQAQYNILPDSTAWHCNNCEYQWGKYPDDIDSFDYDQGFNLGKMYDL